MTRSKRIALRIGGGILALLVVVAIAGLVILRSDWFREKIRERLVTEVERATGGRVEIGSFQYHWEGLTAEVKPFTVHGTEAEGQPPLFQADSVQVGLKIISIMKRDVDIAFLMIDRPRANVIVDANGNTNIPKPKIQSTSSESVDQTLLDLKIGDLQVRNGDLVLADRKIPLNAHAQDVNAHLTYELTGPRYRGDIKLGTLHVDQPSTGPLDLAVNASLSMEKGKLELTSGHVGLQGQSSHMELAGTVLDFNNPNATLHFNGDLAMGELSRPLQLAAAKGTVHLQGQGTYSQADGAKLQAKLNGRDLDIRSGGTAFGGTLDADTNATYKNAAADIAASIHGRGVDLHTSGTTVRGNVVFDGRAHYVSATDYALDGKIAGEGIDIREPGMNASGIRLSSAVKLTPKEAVLPDLKLAGFGGDFDGKLRAELTGQRAFEASGNLNHFSLQQVAVLGGVKGVPYTGSVSGPIKIQGALPNGNLRGLVAQTHLNIAGGQAQGIPVQGSIDLTYDQATQQLRLGDSNLRFPNSNLRVSGTLGQTLQISLQTKNLDDLKPAVTLATGKLMQPLPIVLRGGTVDLRATVQGSIKNPQINGTLKIDRFALENRPVDLLTTQFQANKTNVSVQNLNVRQGPASLDMTASLGLHDWSPQDSDPVTANARLANAQLTTLLSEAGTQSVPVDGTLTFSADVKGTVAAPQAKAQLAVDQLSAYGEHFDRMQANLTYDGGAVDVANGQLNLGPARLQFAANYKHPPKDFTNGRAVFNLSSNGFKLSQFRTIEKERPGIEGGFNLKAAGDADVTKGAFLLTNLNGQVGLLNVSIDKKPVGNLTVDAKTNGKTLTVGTAGDLRNVQVNGNARVELAGNYPGSGELSVSPLVFSNFQDLLAVASQKENLPFDGVVQGKLTFDGPLRELDKVHAQLELPQVEVHPVRRIQGSKLTTQDLTLKNAAPVVFAVRGRTLNIQSARFTGKDTNLEAVGTVSLEDKTPWDLKVNGSLNLGILQSFDADIAAAGVSTLNASVHGTVKNPQLNGQLDLKNASINIVDISNGIDNANGTILFDRNRATIQRLTARSGGGDVNVGGYVQFGSDESVYRLNATASQVRVRQEGVSILVDSNLSLTGTTSRSILSGLVTVRRASLNQQTDVGGLLATSAKPVPSNPSSSEFVRNLQFDVKVESAPNLQFNTSLTNDIQGVIDLRVKGTLDRPVVLGRVTVDQGDVNFFGTKYTINRGEIGFFNPVKIEPVLDLDLETVARGITVTINFSGPITKLNVSYRSDPPLQSSEIIALLTVGRDPGTNPALASSQLQQQSSLFQTGANTLIGQAIGSPVSNRLQRFFGVSKVKIDPQLTGVDNTPQARLTVEQQVSQNVTLTFTTNLTRSSEQIVRFQYDISKNFSVVAIRDENGIFGIDFLYKRRF